MVSVARSPVILPAKNASSSSSRNFEDILELCHLTWLRRLRGKRERNRSPAATLSAMLLKNTINFRGLALPDAQSSTKKSKSANESIACLISRTAMKTFGQSLDRCIKYKLSRGMLIVLRTSLNTCSGRVAEVIWNGTRPCRICRSRPISRNSGRKLPHWLIQCASSKIKAINLDLNPGSLNNSAKPDFPFFINNSGFVMMTRKSPLCTAYKCMLD